MNKRLLVADWLVIIGFCLFIIAHMSTQFLLAYYSNVSSVMEGAREQANLMETNPIARWAFSFNNLRLIFQFVVMPVFFFGSYYYLRKKYKEANPEILETIAMMAFMAALIDASNDISIVLGILAK